MNVTSTDITVCLHRIVRQVAFVFTILFAFLSLGLAQERNVDPVRIGLTAEFALLNSTSAQAVEMGIRVAIDVINSRGGVLGGRPLVLEVRDDRSVPARAIENLKEFAAMKDLVGVFGARFSPVMVELVPLAHELKVILLDPWASADRITRHDYRPNFSFRLALTDSLAMPFLFRTAEERGLLRVGLLLPNTAWGRSNHQAAEAWQTSRSAAKLVGTQWYNWGDTSLLRYYEDLMASGAKAIILTANDREGVILVNEMIRLPKEKRVPILCHQGITGGTFFENTEKVLQEIDFSVIQTFSFFRANPKIREKFMAVVSKLYAIKRFEEIKSPVGVGHAYDLTHLLAMAIDKAGTTDRAAIRTAMEELPPYEGLVGTFERPFTHENHDALGPEQVFMAKYRKDGVLVPIPLRE